MSSRPKRRLILCINAGSSTMKAAMFEVGESGDEHELWRSGVEQSNAPDLLRTIGGQGLGQPDAVGHRVVHGGTHYTRSVLVDDEVLDGLRALVPLAPLHEPPAIAAIEAVAEALPGLPQVVCFDTAFHRTLPEEATRLPLPDSLWDAGLRRFGFHGLSYEYIVSHLGGECLGRAVIGHLGNGASLCAIRDGESVDTTMGFTPAGGVVMGTRPGDLDPGLLVHLLTNRDYDAAALSRLVNDESGLRGLSGGSDMRLILAARSTGDPRATLAISVFCRTITKQIGAYAALLGGLDTLVFTAGIGAHSAEIRSEVCRGLEFLGIEVDDDRNDRTRASGDYVVSSDEAAVTVLAVPTNEELVIARHTAALTST